MLFYCVPQRAQDFSASPDGVIRRRGGRAREHLSGRSFLEAFFVAVAARACDECSARRWQAQVMCITSSYRYCIGIRENLGAFVRGRMGGGCVYLLELSDLGT